MRTMYSLAVHFLVISNLVVCVNPRIINPGTKNTSNCLQFNNNNTCECCKTGYTGQNCLSRCEHCNSRLHNGKCVSFCKPGFYGQSCKETCPRTCAIGNTGQPLCREKRGVLVCVNGCIPGYFNTLCSLPCGLNCRRGLCYQRNGKCLDCTDGFYGDFCNTTCNTKCSHNKCHRNGTCMEGCKKGFYGRECNMLCEKCNKTQCTSHDDFTYNCTEGCVTGYMGMKCTEKCQKDCRTCHQLNGRCTSCFESKILKKGICLNEVPHMSAIAAITSLTVLVIIIIILAIVFRRKIKISLLDRCNGSRVQAGTGEARKLLQNRNPTNGGKENEQNPLLHSNAYMNLLVVGIQGFEQRHNSLQELGCNKNTFKTIAADGKVDMLLELQNSKYVDDVVHWNDADYEEDIVERTLEICHGGADLIIDFVQTPRTKIRTKKLLSDVGRIINDWSELPEALVYILKKKN